jgi:hypothetical protein
MTKCANDAPLLSYTYHTVRYVVELCELHRAECTDPEWDYAVWRD